MLRIHKFMLRTHKYILRIHKYTYVFCGVGWWVVHPGSLNPEQCGSPDFPISPYVYPPTHYIYIYIYQNNIDFISMAFKCAGKRGARVRNDFPAHLNAMSMLKESDGASNRNLSPKGNGAEHPKLSLKLVAKMETGCQGPMTLARHETISRLDSLPPCQPLHYSKWGLGHFQRRCSHCSFIGHTYTYIYIYI
jgi:hypothetical protein